MENQEIQHLVEQFFSEKEMPDCFFVACKIDQKTIEVFVDSDEGISFGTCKMVSRHLEAIFDEKNSFGEEYCLDVSSPGVGSPLKLKRQYVKNIGRTTEVKHHDMITEGLLKSADDDNIIVEIDAIELDGKKKIKIKKDVTIAYAEISEAIIKISFK